MRAYLQRATQYSKQYYKNNIKFMLILFILNEYNSL